MALVDSALTETTTSPPSLSDRDFAIVAHVKQLFYRARQVRRPVVAQWVRNYNILRNKTWGTARAQWMPTPEVPEIYPIISAIVGWMTDQRPQFEVTPSRAPFHPENEFFDRLAQDLNTVLDAVWTEGDYDTEVEKVIWDVFVYGIGLFKSLWDPKLTGGIGDAALKRVDPFTIYPDPDARSLDDALYIIEVQNLSAQEVERRFPGALRKIGGAGFQEAADESPTITDENRGASMPKAHPAAIPPATSPRFGLPGQTDRAHATDEPGITVWEAWLRTPVTVDEGTDNERSYDAWRVVVIAGNVVLMDEMAEDVWSHGQHPYERMVAHDTGEFYGFSMVELLSSMQISINRLLAAMEHNIWLIGNPVFMEDTRSGINRTRITNKPGQRVTKNPGGEAGWLNPPQMHPQMSSDLVRFYIGEMERVSGLSAVVRGATPTGRNAQGVIDAVQEAAFVRIRMALRNLERALRRSGDKIASLITEFYDTPRQVAIVGQSGEKTSLALRGNHWYLPSPEGRVPMRFVLHIETGSSLPTAHSQRAAEADTLFALGAIDEEALLEAHQFPNRHEIVARVREMKAGGLMEPPGARQRARR